MRARWLDARGIRSKRRVTRKGRALGGQTFSRGALFHLLRNRTYLGMIVHRGKVHPGMHAAVVDADLFEAVQCRLDANVRRHAAERNPVARAPLTGCLFDADGQPMSPTFSYGRKGKLYRYFVSAPLQQGHRRACDDDAIRRVPAAALEERLSEIVCRLAPSRASEPLDLLTRVEIHPRAVHLMMPVRLLPMVRGRLAAGEQVEADPVDPSRLRLLVPERMQPRGGRRWILSGSDRAARQDPVLVRALRAAHALVRWERPGMPVLDTAPASPHHRRLVRLAFLAPDLQRAILAGRQPPGLSLGQLLDRPLPLAWREQADCLSMTTPA